MALGASSTRCCALTGVRERLSESHHGWSGGTQPLVARQPVPKRSWSRFSFVRSEVGMPTAGSP